MLEYNIKSEIKQVLSLPLVKNTMKLSSSSALLMFLPLIVTPVLSRLYTPVDYGDWGVFSSVFYIVNSFLFLSYENTIVRSNDKKEVPILVGLCLLVSFSIIGLVNLVFLGGRIAGVQFFLEFPCLPLLILLLVVTSIHTIAINMANREGLYGKMAIANATNGLSQAVLRIVFGLLSVGYGLIWGNLLAHVLAVVLLLIFMKDIVSTMRIREVFDKESIKSSAIYYRKFPLFDAPARLIEFSIGNLALIILTYFWSREEIGFYSMVVQFILMPISVIGSAMGNVYYREISERIDDSSSLAVSTHRAARIAFLFSLLPILFLALGGDKLLVLFLGAKWEAAGKMALCMVIYSVPVIQSESLLPIFRALDKQELRFRLNLLCMFLSLGGLIITSLLTRSIYFSLIVYSVFFAVARYIMYYKLIRLSGLRMQNISNMFYYLTLLAYVILGIRLYIEFI